MSVGRTTDRVVEIDGAGVFLGDGWCVIWTRFDDDVFFAVSV